MSPSSNGGMELPPPISEQSHPIELSPEAQKPVEERPSYETGAETLADLSKTTAIPIPAADDTAQTSLPTSAPAIPDSDSDDQAAATDNGDTIERRWVDQVKSIVAHTKEDPYKQSEEITQLKANYLKEAHNITLKLDT